MAPPIGDVASRGERRAASSKSASPTRWTKARSIVEKPTSSSATVRRRVGDREITSTYPVARPDHHREMVSKRMVSGRPSTTSPSTPCVILKSPINILAPVPSGIVRARKRRSKFWRSRVGICGGMWTPTILATPLPAETSIIATLPGSTSAYWMPTYRQSASSRSGRACTADRWTKIADPPAPTLAPTDSHARN